MNLTRNYIYNGSSATKLEVTINTVDTSIANNTTIERVVVKFIHTGYSFDNDKKTATLYFNGYRRTKTFSYSGSTTITLFDFRQTITHDADGSKSVYLKINDDRGNMPYTGVVAVNERVTLDKIPRYAKITNFNLTYKDANNAEFNAQTDVDCNYWRYKVDDGEWQEIAETENRETSFSVNNLTPNTSYLITVSAKRADSGLYTEKAIRIKTDDICRVIDLTGKFIGENNNVTINKKDENVVTRLLIKYGDSVLKEYEEVPEIITYTENEIDRIYSFIPDSRSIVLSYEIENIQDGKINISSFKKTLMVKDANPVFKDFDFKDISACKELTGDEHVMISGHSKIEVTVPEDKKAIAQKHATITRYIITLGNQSSPYITNSPITWTFSNVITNNVQVTVYDSRELSTTIIKNFNLIQYKSPIITEIQVSRKDGISQKAMLNIKGKYTNVNFGAVENKILLVEYRYKESDREFTEWSNITTTVAYDTKTGEFHESSMNEFGDFPFGIEFDVEIRVQDMLGVKDIATAKINSGKPLIVYDKEYQRIGVGIVPWKEEEGVYFHDKIYSRYIDNKNIEQDARIKNIEESIKPKNIVLSAFNSNLIFRDSYIDIDKWVEYEKIGDKLTVTPEGIKIGAGVSLVRIDIRISYRHLGSNAKSTPSINVFKDYTPLTTSPLGVTASVNDEQSLIVNGLLARVNENELIKVQVVRFCR